VAALGAVAGDSVSFWLGRRFGTDVIDRWRWVKRRWAPSLRRAQHHFERRGGLSVAVARWVGALRAVVPVVAGTAGMPYRTLLVWDAPSALGWSAVVATLGFALGDDIASVVDRLGLGGVVGGRDCHRRDVGRAATPPRMSLRAGSQPTQAGWQV